MSGKIFKQCGYCRYGWQARVLHPKSCPRCKRRFDYKEARAVLKNLEHMYGHQLLGVENG